PPRRKSGVRLHLLFCWLAAVAPAGFGCARDFDVFNPQAAPSDSGLPSDAEAGQQDGSGDGGVFCGTTGVANCEACAARPLDCAGRCVANCKTDCGGASGSPIECIGCNASNAPTVHRCVPASSPASCLGGAAQRCRAPDSVSQCPGPRQVRSNESCYACGEPN